MRIVLLYLEFLNFLPREFADGAIADRCIVLRPDSQQILHLTTTSEGSHSLSDAFTT